MPSLLVARGTAIAWRAVAAPPVIPPAVGVDLRRWRLVTRGRRGVAWQRTVVGAAGTSFSVSAPAVASALVIGAPSVSFTFGVSAPAVASSLVIGTPTVVFVGGFSVSAPLLASTVTYGTAVASFTAGTSLEPITLDEAKTAARQNDDEHELDAFITDAISAAREHAEHITGRTYRRRVFRTELADWPAAGHSFHVHDPSGCEISYYSPTGWQVLDTAAFEFAGIDNGAQVAPALDTTWPELGRRALGARVRIDFTAGPASPDDVPEQVKLYIKAQVAAWADNPSGLIAGNLQPHPFLERLLDAEVLWC